MLLALLSLSAPGLPAAAADSVQVQAQPVAAPAGLARQLGPLRYQAGWSLRSADPRFGGLSGLWLSPDGQRLMAVSDRGWLWRAQLERDPDGGLQRLSAWQVQRLPRAQGGPTSRYRDAEALAPDGADGLVVAFEGAHRLERLQPADPAAPAVALPRPPGLEEPHNHGIEALAGLSDGSWLALSERVTVADGVAAWQIAPTAVRPLAYRPAAGFAPTGADRLGEQIYVVERRVSWLGGLQTRLVRLPETALTATMPLEGSELARFRFDELGENFEAIAAVPQAAGGTLLYLLSDDNFNAGLRTLLLELLLPAPPPA